MPIPVIAAALLSKGLDLLGNAVLAKGKEVIEEKLGVSLKENPSAEELLAYKRLEIEHEEFLINLVTKHREQELEFQKTQEITVTDRWKADMGSDSWLSKNIRPIVLIYILTAYTIFSIGSGFHFDVAQAYVELLGQWGMLIMTAYFGGRTLEKIISMKEKGGEK